MAGKAFRTSARGATPGQLVAATTEDRRVRIRVAGHALQRIGFTEADVSNNAGFLLPEDTEFLLEAGDDLYLAGVVPDTNETTFLYVLVTKEV